LHRSGSGWGQAVGSYKSSKNPSGSIKLRGFLDLGDDSIEFVGYWKLSQKTDTDSHSHML
jgi:hypothetical protein